MLSAYIYITSLYDYLVVERERDVVVGFCSPDNHILGQLRETDRQNERTRERETETETGKQTDRQTKNERERERAQN